MNIVAQMKADMANGIPKEVVLRYAYTHIKALRETTLTEDRKKAEADVLSFIQEHSESETIGEQEFVALAEQILTRLGSSGEYEDHVIRIGSDSDVKYIYWQANNNPTTMWKDGNVIRHHGEHIYLTSHMKSLLE